MTFQPPPPPPGQPPYGEQPPYGGQPGYGAPQPPQQPPAQPAPPQYAPPPPPAQPQYAAPQQPQYAPPPAQYAPQGYGAPAPGGPGFSMASFDPKTVDPMDWAILGIGFLALVFSFFGYYTIDVSFLGQSASESYSAYHGFFGWFSSWLALLSAGLVAVEIFAPQLQTKSPIPLRLASLGGFALATLCVLLALFVYPGAGAGGIATVSHGFSYWISLVLIIAGLVLSVLRLKATGGKLPWEKGPGMSSGPTGFGGPGGSIPPQGYAPPASYDPPPSYDPPGGYNPPAGYTPPPPPPGYNPPQQ
jgi:hypothetical protein